MKFFSTIIIIAVISAYNYSCNSSTPKSTSPNDSIKKKTVAKKSGLKGKVKQVKISYYEAKGKFGEVIQGKKFDVGLDPYLTIYNEQGNFIEKNQLFPGRYDFVDTKNTYKYNDKGNVIEIYNNYNLYGKYTYKYDDNENVIEENQFQADGSLIIKYTNKYNAKGNMIEKNYYNSDGSFGGKYSWKYDEKGNMIEGNDLNADGTFGDNASYKYDEKGNNIEKKRYNTDGSLSYQQTYKYDDKGNLIELSQYNADGSFNMKRTYTYDYDKQGNWIKRTQFDNDNPVQICEREIIYF